MANVLMSGISGPIVVREDPPEPDFDFIDAGRRLGINVFCPTGKGGGVDPSCSLGTGSGSNRTISKLGDLPNSVVESGKRTESRVGKNKAIKRAVDDYTRTTFVDINADLRKKRNPTGGDKTTVKHLDGLTSGKFDSPVTVYRGTGKSGRGVLKIAEQASKGEGPSILRDRAFVSTSVDPKMTAKFTGRDNVVLQIKAKRGAYLTSKSRSSGFDEQEVLLPRNNRYRIGKIDRNVRIEGVGGPRHGKKFTIIHLEQLDG